LLARWSKLDPISVPECLGKWVIGLVGASMEVFTRIEVCVRTCKDVRH
jgi:hypothetical protein